MRLDSVRELKRSLPAHLNKTFAVRAAAGKTSSLAVASAASLRRESPSYFLGISARGKKDYRLAVRLQDRALERSELVDRIAARAKGEVDVRYVGRIRARAKPWYRSKQRPLLIGSSTGSSRAGSSWPARWGASSGPGRRPRCTSCRTTTSWRTRTDTPRADPSFSPARWMAGARRRIASPSSRGSSVSSPGRRTSSIAPSRS